MTELHFIPLPSEYRQAKEELFWCRVLDYGAVAIVVLVLGAVILGAKQMGL